MLGQLAMEGPIVQFMGQMGQVSFLGLQSLDDIQGLSNTEMGRMGVLFFRVPAGLCIYFITSSTWSLIERFLIKKYTPQAEIKSLPEGTVNEILSAVANTPPGQRPTMPSAPRGDKPKLKNTKPPET
ncbi:MAG: hypothetical protein ACKOAH_27005, partial [Pirellula sp.]